MAADDDDETLSMLTRMRDQMERINSKEIELFDAIIKKMTESRAETISKQNQLILQQAEYINVVTDKVQRNEDKIDDLNKLVARLVEKKKSYKQSLIKGSTNLAYAIIF